MQPLASKTLAVQPDIGFAGTRSSVTEESSASAISWAAVLSGAAAAASLSLILLILGAGLGFSAVSPWADRGVHASTLGVSAIVWLALTQIVASAMGGYLAGRLRVKWSGVHTDEVYFRDTAHGFLAWSVATLAMAMLLSSTLTGIGKGTAQAGAGLAATAAQAGAPAAAMLPGSGAATTTNLNRGYAVDSLFRGDTAGAESKDGAPNAEVDRIFSNALQAGQLSADDQHYLAQRVAKRTGLSETDAEKRTADAYAKLTKAIADTEAKAKQAADTARKSAAYGALWMFVALLAGAFCASFGATLGGRQRDQ